MSSANSELETLFARKQARIDELLRCQPGATALLVIDMQRGFLDQGAALEIPSGREIIPNLQRLIAAAREGQAPVIFTRFVYSEDQPNLRGDPFGPEHLPNVPGEKRGLGRPSSNCLLGEQGVDSPEIIEALKPRPGETVIDGRVYDKFLGTDLDRILREQGIRCLLVTGLTTDVCVHTTLCTASMLEYRVTGVTDGVATLWPHIQEACLDIWRRKFARLRSTDEIIQELNSFPAAATAQT